MNTIKIFLAESGRIADVKKDFPLYQGQFNDKLLNVFVPTSILAPQFEIQHYIGQITGAEEPTSAELETFVGENTYPSREPQNGDIVEFFNTDGETYWTYIFDGTQWTETEVDSFGTFNNIAGTNVKLGMLATTRSGTIYKSKSYFMRYVKTATYQNDGEAVEYALYERKLPKEFTTIAGQGENAPTLVANVVNVDTSDNSVLSVITTQTCKFDVMQSTMLDQDETIESSDLEDLEADINTLSAEIDLKQNQIDDRLTTTQKSVVGAINELDGEVAENTTDISNNASDIADIQAEQLLQNAGISSNTERISTNEGDISSLKTRVTTIENTMSTGENPVGQMTGTSLPTDTALNDYVYSVEGRATKIGDVVKFILQIPDETDKVYKYSYNAEGWDYYEIPATEPASNTSLGLVKGSYNPANKLTQKTQVNIVGGEIENVYVTDNTGTQRNLHEYLNTDHATLADNVNATAQNTQDIQANENAINTNKGNINKILDGTTEVGKAEKAEQDANGNVIPLTYMTINAGATKQQLYNYALPRAFNDVSFVSADNEFSSTIPSTQTALYTATTDAVGDFTLFYADKTIGDYQFQLGNKNSYTTTLYVTANQNCTVAFRVLTEMYINDDWVLLNAELTEPVTLVANTIKRVNFGSAFNYLDEVLSVTQNDVIRQTFEVQTQSSTQTTFSVFSNETYPSTFYLNTTAQTITVAQGYLGELPYFDLFGTLANDTITFEIPSGIQLENNVLATFKLNYSSQIASGTYINLIHNSQTIQILTPYNYGSNVDASIDNLEQAYINGSGILFAGLIKIDASDNIQVLANLDNLTDVKNDISGLQQTTNDLQNAIGNIDTLLQTLNNGQGV